MGRSRKNGDDGPGLDTQGWLTTFADLVMLLLTFFVLLLTMSSMDTKKLRDSFSQFHGAPGVLELGTNQRITTLAGFVKNYYASSEHMMVVDQDLMRKMLLPTWDRDTQQSDTAKENLMRLDELVSISDDNLGITVSFHGEMFFNPGRAEIKSQMLPFLDTVAEAIEMSANGIVILGHTDNVPTQGGASGSNRTLSLKRAIAVLDYFVQIKKLSPARFAVGGYGASHPLVPNNTPENRKKNRRVDIIFKYL